MGPECQDPSDPDANLHIIQLGREGMVRATGSQIHQHCHLPPLEGMKVAADKGPHPSIRLAATLDNLTQGL
jgi:hypothetical protein